jgi:phosphatidylserine/phosphatidylglycerophosphate/cardiolipin synthase-like enzyme
MSLRFQLLPTQLYFNDLLLEIRRAKKRISIQSLYFDPGDHLDEIITALIEKQKGGILVELIIDSFGKNPQMKTDRFESALAKLIDNHVAVTFINPLPMIQNWIFPYLHRNHIKIALIDDVLYFGGINFSNLEHSFQDVMVKVADKKLSTIFSQIILHSKQQMLKDDQIWLDNKNMLLVEGINTQSIIYQSALSLISKAKKSIVFTSQFLPDGKMLDSLYQSGNRGTKLTIIVPIRNHFNRVFELLNRWNNLMIIIKQRNLPLHKVKSMIHGKILLIDNQTLLIGSHNLCWLGVASKSSEIMLQSTDRNLINQVKQFTNHLIADNQGDSCSNH